MIFEISAVGELNEPLIINITLPNGTVSTFTLSTVSELVYSPQLTGTYNVTWTANYSTCRDSFIAMPDFMPAQIKAIQVNETQGIDNLYTNASFYLPGTNKLVTQENFSGIVNITQMYNLTLDIEFIQYDKSLKVRLNNVNMGKNYDRIFGADLLEIPIRGFLVTYGLNTTFEYGYAVVFINYSSLNYSDEDKLYLLKCDNWDFENTTCLGNWIRRNDSIQDKKSNIFTIVVSNFSGFSIGETSSIPTYGSSGTGIDTSTIKPAQTSIKPVTISTSVPSPQSTSAPVTLITSVPTPILPASEPVMNDWLSALLGFALPGKQEVIKENCEACDIGGLNYGWWILCWYWWVLIFTILLIRIIYITYNINSKLHDSSKSRNWIPVGIIFIIPFAGFIGAGTSPCLVTSLSLITFPINWVTGIVIELMYIVYLIFKLRKKPA